MSKLNKTIKSIIENDEFGVQERADCIEELFRRKVDEEKTKVGAFLIDKINTLDDFDKENVKVLLSYYLTHAEHYNGVSFESFDDFTNFMVFCHIHFELNDVWFNHDHDKGILFEGWCDNNSKSQDANKYSPSVLGDTDPLPHRKRTQLWDVYEAWVRVKKKSTADTSQGERTHEQTPA